MNRIEYRIVPEVPRRIIREQIMINGDGLPWKNKALYSQLMSETSLTTYQSAVKETSSNTVFFDRGILDTICYIRMENMTVLEELYELAKTQRYAQKVFILPPCQEIYRVDTERKQTWREAVYTFDKMKVTYLHYGYEVVEVPKGCIEDRCKFLLSHTQ
ncbi:AAA family ATPase [Chryseobacterium bernardetii]|uniref:AAA family ATPase n=1 Tax=Chryseobacterium bernardetii TaxID=1241978 RepID=UPI0021D170F8|nr:AAA family ATPase [Chryseobacterium bernardetii]